ARCDGKRQRLAANRDRHSARGGDFATACEHLPQPTGPPDGPARLGDGTLRRRLHHPVRQCRISASSTSDGTTMDGASRVDPASDAAGEWLKYSVNVTTPGRYTLSCRLSAVVDGGAFHIEFDGVDKTGPVSVPN